MTGSAAAAIATAMANATQDNGIGGGIFIALGPLIGLGLGWLLDEPSIGLLIGLAGGIVLAIAIWLSTRSKSES